MAKTRAAAARAVAAVLGGQSLSEALPPVLQGLPLRDRGLAQELAYGTLREFEPLAFLADGLLKARPKPHEVFALILVGLYQLLHTRVPEHAAVHSTVEACALLRAQRLGGLVNGVLRSFMREKDMRLNLLQQAEPAVQQALPRWLYTRLERDWPGENLALALRQHAPMSLRVNAAHGSREDYLMRLQQAEIDAEATRHADCGLRLAQAVAVERLPGFADGDVSVQDEAAQLCAQLCAQGGDLLPGIRVLDACAAPGGKTLALLERQPALDMLALDSDAERLGRVHENLSRARLTARVQAGDAAAPQDWWDGQPFDLILLDAPCSATGVIRRHPDIKRLRRAEDIAQLAAQQERLLAALWPLLAAGGRLLYMTCSMLREENEARISAHLARLAPGAAREIPLQAVWGRACAHGRQILAGEDGMDGFYYALLEKIA
ncbi:MAG: 16S rRNA (cytosine(967)-C(5))-methyltransferase RsmB [Pseudomonadota bacterium]